MNDAPLLSWVPPDRKFNGPEYQPSIDHSRLRGQMLRIWQLMQDGRWRTLGEIEAITGDPQASISAQLRHFRKTRFGALKIERQHRGERGAALFEYRINLFNVMVTDANGKEVPYKIETKEY